MTEAVGSFLAVTGSWFLSSWLVMLILPYVTNQALTPGYWQVVGAEFILTSVAGVVALSVKTGVTD